MIIDVAPNDIKISQDNMVIISDLPAFRIVGKCLEFIDRDKLRCKARGGNRVRVRVIDLVTAMKNNG